MMINRNSKTSLRQQKIMELMSSPITILMATVLLAGLIHLALNFLFGARTWMHEPAHSSIETSGALIALILSPLVLIQNTRNQENKFCVWFSSSFVAMGILDLVHAFLPVGSVFYFTRAVGTFVGGLLVSMVWLNSTLLKNPIANRLPWFVGFASFALGITIWLFTPLQNDSLRYQQILTVATASLNNIGSIGFLAAAAYFLYGIPKQETKHNQIFAQFCLMFAVSGILFFFASGWSAAWWFFHFLRLAAFSTIVVFLTSTFRQSLRLARQTNLELEKEISNRTLQLATANRNLQTEVQERSSSEAELQRIRSQLEATLKAMKDQVVVFDMKGNLVFINHFEEQAQLISKSALKKDLSYFTDRFKLFDTAGVTLPFKNWPVCRVLRGETVPGEDYKMHRQGDDFDSYFHFSGGPVFDQNGAQILAVLVVREITDIKKNELRLIESEARFRQLADSMPQIVWSSEANGKPQYYNRRWFEYTGQNPGSQDLEDKWVSVMHPEDLPICMRKWKDALETGEAFQAECRLKNKEGQYRWHLSRASHLKATLQSPERWYGTSTDIHDHKILIEEITEKQAQLSLAIVAAEIETWNMDLLKGEIKSSLSYSKILGMETNEVQSVESIRERIFTEDREPLKNAIENAVAGHKDYIAEYRMRRRDGELRWIYSRGRPFYDAEGRALRMCGVSMDITERKQLEENLKEALNKANEANKLKSAFLANMSHEIRTPLGAILGFTDLLREESLTDEEREHFFDVINRNGEQLSNLINDILDLSKVESGNFRIEILKTDFRKILQEVIALHQFKADQKKLQLNFRVEDTVPLCVGTDPTRLKQILTNLVGNAIKFTQSGFVHVHAMMNGSNSLRVQVQDSGMGLTEKERDRLFQPFSQADSSTTRRFGGTGLGLVLSRKLARALGGDLSILSSQPGVGSIFEVCIQNHSGDVIRENPIQRATEPTRAPH